MNIETHSAQQWGSTNDFAAIPAALIHGDMSPFPDQMATDLGAISQIIATDTGLIRTGTKSGEAMDVHFSIGDQIAYLFVGHKQNPDIFSQITVHGFSEPEVMNLLERINDDRLN